MSSNPGGVDMKPAQAALKLVLDELQMDAAIKTVAERKAVQKAVYLVQAAGVDLGYRYNWYVMGPYSPALTKDYFGLDEALAAGESASSQELRPEVRRRIERAAAAAKTPDDLNLPEPDWLELTASLHFLLTARRMTKENAESVLEKEKGHVHAYADRAYEALLAAQLISA